LKKKVKNGKDEPVPLDAGTLNGHRSALKFLFTAFGKSLPDSFSTKMAVYMKGQKRKTAKRKANGKGKVQVGKSPMKFPLYQAICLQLLRSASSGSIFAHTYLTISWNLMCRAGNTASICFSHLEWAEDALGIYFAHMKNDQEGDRPRDARHIYANPLQPEVCAILSLAIYLLCFRCEEKDIKLFPGSNQYDRYHKALKAVYEDESFVPYLTSQSLTPEMLGTHSTRKGAASYVSSGSTAAPSNAAVHHRAGWKMNNVTDRYIQYEAAGDQYVGRTLAGLPVNDPRFGILPPFFPDDTTSDLTTAIAECFPKAPFSLNAFFPFGIASVVYHADFLLKNLPSTHPLFATPLFRNSVRFSRLQEAVVCRLSTPGDRFHATGLSPFAILMKEVAASRLDSNNIIAEVQKIAPVVLRGVDELLEKRSYDAGQISHTVLERMLNEKIDPLVSQMAKLDGTMPARTAVHTEPNKM
jgi:hypothetical protein